jgi:hypothetical protein
MSHLSIVDDCLDMIGHLSDTMQQHNSLKRHCMELWYDVEDQKIADREAAQKHKVEQSEATHKHEADGRVEEQASLTLQLELGQVNLKTQKFNVEIERIRMRCLELSAVAGDMSST